MQTLESLFQSGHIAFVILAIMLLEALVLARYIKRVPGLFFALAAGACLVLALRGALLQHGWMEIGLYLALSFVFHVLELRQWLHNAKHQPQ
jgi:MFS superfamily sulfate permease-like transporter